VISIEHAKSLYADADSAHDFDHILRVLDMAEKIARAEGADVEIVRTAALLHDIARADEDHGGVHIDHADVSAERARAILLDRGANEEFAERVAEAIRAHRFRGSMRPETLEAQVLFDADKLDSIGAIGIARAYAVAGSLNQRLYTETAREAVETAGETHATRDQHNSNHSPVAEYRVKLSKLHERFHTPTARALAEARHQFMAEFFDRLAREVRGEC
jgi:uncharacterized protein